MANVFIEESIMQAIGNAIRAKTGKSEGILPSDMPAEIESIQAGDNYYDTFWDVYQTNGTRTNYSYAFYGPGWNKNNFQPKYWQALGDGTIASAISMFSETKIPRIEYDLDFSNCSNCSYLFKSNIYTSYIKSIKFNNTGNNSNMFASMAYLVNIGEIKGVIDFNLVMGSCKRLSIETLIKIINALEDHGPNGLNDGVTHTLDLHADSIALINSYIEENPENNLIAIASAKGWSII